MISTRHMLAIAAVAALAAGPLCAGANTGTVTHIAGTLSAKKPDGTTRVLSPRAEVGSGETISTERDSHAQIRFADGGQVTLKPSTSFKIENFSFAKDKPKDDSFLTGLLTGGLRMVTGLVGSRSRNKLLVGTATATIGIRGTTFSAHDCLASACGQLKPAVYVGVSNGSIVVSNPAGQLRLAAGQFGIIEKGQAPRVTPNPGLSIEPPQAFSRPAAPGGKPAECVVR
ncbi:MAG: FecR domain-containing protein [Betaproteobacteria bacterium]|nr:FecR domain-containing protein [Betaproteobacteria bacterium]